MGVQTSEVVGGHPVSDLFADRRANLAGIPIVHTTVHPCIDDFSPEIVSLLEDMRRACHRAVESEVDPRRACEVFENSGRRTRPAPVCRRVSGCGGVTASPIQAGSGSVPGLPSVSPARIAVTGRQKL